jgi:hypothetical protein
LIYFNEEKDYIRIQEMEKKKKGWGYLFAWMIEIWKVLSEKKKRCEKNIIGKTLINIQSNLS